MTLIRQNLKKEYNPTKVGIVEFSESTDYCGKPLFPLQRVLLKLFFLEEMEGWEEDLLTWMINGGRNNEILLSPGIRERREICRDRDMDHFGEIDLVGGRRSSKGYITGLAGTKKIWDVQQIPDPGKYYGLDADKEIYFQCVAASLDQAKKYQFADLYSCITRCAALAPYISKTQEESISIKCEVDDANIARMQQLGLKIARDFSKLRVRPLAANADTLRGAAALLLIFDEMAFMMPGESRSSAQECYNAAEPSLAQFGQHALLFCNSSPYTRIGQFYEQYALAMRAQDHADGWYPQRMAIQFPSWSLFDKWWVDPHKRFKHPVMVSPDWTDQLEVDVPESQLDDFSIGKREEEQLKERANPDSYKVERRAQWAEVLDAYLSPEKVDQAFTGKLPSGIPFGRTFGGSYVYTYMGHCDPSSTTAGFGFAMGHVEEFPDETGLFPDGVARHVVFDIVKRWNPADFPGGVINYISVREELTVLANLYRPVAITFDQYNSPGLIQELREETRKLGIVNLRVNQVTATQAGNWNRWEAFKTALYLGLVHVPKDCINEEATGIFDHSEYAKQELKFLQEVQTGQTKRVDKQSLGPIQTKDIADCIAEVTVKFLGSYIGDIMDRNFQASRMQPGAEGGYPIGGRHPGGAMNSKQGRETRFEDFYGRKGANFSSARGINRRGRGH